METTAICTMDDPHRVEVGRAGPAIPGMEIKLGEERRDPLCADQIFFGSIGTVRSKPLGRCATDGFHTGDQANKRGRELENRGTNQESDRARPLTIFRAGADRDQDCEPATGSAASSWWATAKVIFVGGDCWGCDCPAVARKRRSMQCKGSCRTTNALRAFCVTPEAFSIENEMTAIYALKRDVIFVAR